MEGLVQTRDAIVPRRTWLSFFIEGQAAKQDRAGPASP